MIKRAQLILSVMYLGNFLASPINASLQMFTHSEFFLVDKHRTTSCSLSIIVVLLTTATRFVNNIVTAFNLNHRQCSFNNIVIHLTKGATRNSHVRRSSSAWFLISLLHFGGTADSILSLSPP